MKFLASSPLFQIGDFGITLEMLIIGGACIILLIALIAFTVNYRTQMKVSLNMDTECNVYNKKGLEIFLKKNRNKISNPVLLLVKIENLDYLYRNYPKRVKLMVGITDHLLKGLGKHETLARVSFEKFILVLENKSREEIKALVTDLDERLDALELADYGKYNFYLSYGAYEKPELKDINLDIVRTLFIPQYSTMVEDNIAFYCEDVNAKINQYQKMNIEKQSAFENQQFVPYIQPKVDFQTGEVVGGEIFVRWVDSDGSFLYEYDDFISLFESTGFIRQIDFLMLDSACNLVQSLIEKGKTDIVISLNLSLATLYMKDFDKRVAEVLNKYQIPAQNIQFEIKDSDFIQSKKQVVDGMNQLRQMGFQIAMDNFGREASSLEPLSNLPADTIKIDQIFFANHLSTEKNQCIVEHMIQMLAGISFTTVCLGIKDKETMDVLATISRDVILQGDYLSMPIPLPQFDAFTEKKFEFNYPNATGDVSVQEGAIAGVSVQTAQPVNGGTSINISGLSSSTAEMDIIRRQMEDMQRNFQRILAEEREAAHAREMKHAQEQMEMMRKLQEAQQPEKSSRDYEIEMLRREIELMNKYQNAPQRDTRDAEIELLRREIEMLRYKDQYYVHDDSSSKLNEMQKQIEELKASKQSQIDVDDLIAKLSQKQSESVDSKVEQAQEEAKDLREQLEQERKEREELEAMLADLQNSSEEEELSEEEMQREQEQADESLNLDISSLGKEDDKTDDSTEDDEEEEEKEKIDKPTLTLEEVEAIIKSYQDKYMDEWNKHAKDELKDGYYEVINGLKYYKGDVVKKTFVDKIKKADPEVKKLFNIVKNEIMKYSGVVNKLTNSYDSFYIGRKKIAKMSLTSKKIKIFLAVDPSQFPTSQFPHKDVSGKKAHAQTPYYTLLKSQLSVRRINKVIAEMMSNNGLTENANYKPIDYATKYKFYKSNQK